MALTLDEINKNRKAQGLPPLTSTTQPAGSMIPTTEKKKPAADLGGFLDKPLETKKVGVTKATAKAQTPKAACQARGGLFYWDEETQTCKQKELEGAKKEEVTPILETPYSELSGLEKTVYKTELGTERLKEDELTFKEKVALKKEQISAQKEQQKIQTEAAEGGVRVGFAESRLGLTTSAAKKAEELGFDVLNRQTASFMNIMAQNEISLGEAETAMARAIEDNDINAIDTITREIVAIQEANAKIQADLESKQDEKSADMLERFENMGGEVADMSIDALSNFFSGTDVSLGEALLLQQKAMADAELAQVDNIENRLKVQKLQKEIEQMGIDDLPSSAQEFEFYQNLLKTSPLQAQEYAQMTGITDDPSDKKYGFTTIDGELYATDPTTGKAVKATVNAAGVPIAPEFGQVGNGNITYNYGSTSANQKDNVLLQNGTYGTPGVDMDGQTGDVIQSFMSGTVTQVASNGGYGNQVVITDKKGAQHMYSHLRELPDFLSVGQKINDGDIMGYMGNTGTVFGIGAEGEAMRPAAGDIEMGSHLDYRIKGAQEVNGSFWINPNEYLRKDPAQENLDIILEQIKGGNYTPKEASDFRADFIKAGRGSEFAEVISSPKNKAIAEKTATKFNVPVNITTGQLDSIVAKREAEGLGNRRFQGFDEKSYGQLVDFLELETRLNQIKEISDAYFEEGGDLGEVVEFGRATQRTLKQIPLVGDILFWQTEELTLFDKLMALTGENLADYVKEMSGAAVSDQEFKRLAKNKPNVNLTKQAFKSQLERMTTEYQESLGAKIERWGFSDMGQLRQAVYGSQAGGQLSSAELSLGDIKTNSYIDKINQEVNKEPELTPEEQAIEDYINSLNLE